MFENKFIVIYTDQGPVGPCGQCMRTTSPHSVIKIFDSEEDYRQKFPEGFFGRKGKNWKTQFAEMNNYSHEGICHTSWGTCQLSIQDNTK